VTLETTDASATGEENEIVNVPEPLVIDASADPDPTWKVPALFQTLATVLEVANIGSAVEVVES
jgi:hypothetical protein